MGAIAVPQTSRDLQDMPSSLEALKRLRAKADASGYELYDLPEVPASDFGIKGDGSTANSSLVNTAIDQLSTAGGGVLVLPSSNNPYLWDGPVTLKKFVEIRLGPGAQLQWAGAAGGTMFTSPSNDVLVFSGVQGGMIDAGDAARVFDLHSTQFCEFGRHYITGDNQASIIYNLVADSSGSASSPVHLRNSFGNTFENIFFGFGYPAGADKAGKLIVLDSNFAGSVFNTLNSFHHLFASGIYQTGIDFVKGCDNNNFTGLCTIQLVGDNSIGAEFNSGNPTQAQNVVNILFDHLAVDGFSGGGWGNPTGRTGIKLNHCANIKVDSVHLDVSGTGANPLVYSAYTQSFMIRGLFTGSNNIEIRQRGVNTVTV